MKKILGVAIILSGLCAGSAYTQQPPQVFTGRLSDSTCGASHQPRAGSMSERECIFECIKALAKYVLVDQDNALAERFKIQSFPTTILVGADGKIRQVNEGVTPYLEFWVQAALEHPERK